MGAPMTDYTPAQEEAVRTALLILSRRAKAVAEMIYTDGLELAGEWLAGLPDGRETDAVAVFVADRLRGMEEADSASFLDRVMAVAKLGPYSAEPDAWEVAAAIAERVERQAQAARIVEAFAIGAEIRDALR